MYLGFAAELTPPHPNPVLWAGRPGPGPSRLLSRDFLTLSGKICPLYVYNIAYIRPGTQDRRGPDRVLGPGGPARAEKLGSASRADRA